jgi:hypothetical protein
MILKLYDIQVVRSYKVDTTDKQSIWYLIVVYFIIVLVIYLVYLY